MRWGRRNNGRLETPTATTDQDLDSWRSTLSLVHDRVKEALTSRDSLNALRYAQTGNFAQQNVLLLEGRPTEIIGGLPEHQSKLTAILARFERVDGKRLAPRIHQSLPAVVDPPAARAALGATPADLTPADITSEPLVKVPRRYKGRKDAWPVVPTNVTSENDGQTRT